MYSRSGGGPSGSSHGVTRWIFFQCTASMSTIRSLRTGMLPIGSTVIDAVAAPLAPPCRGACGRRGPGWPLIRTPQEPQIAARHEQRMPIEPSSRSLAWRIAVEHRAVPLEVDRVLLPVRRLPRLGE